MTKIRKIEQANVQSKRQKIEIDKMPDKKVTFASKVMSAIVDRKAPIPKSYSYANKAQVQDAQIRFAKIKNYDLSSNTDPKAFSHEKYSKFVSSLSERDEKQINKLIDRKVKGEERWRAR